MNIEYIVTSLIVVLIPGTGVLYTISTGVLRGKRASAYAAMGCTLGIVPHILAAFVGLSAVLHSSAMAFHLLKWFGVVYLLYLAYMTWKEKQSFEIQQDVGVRAWPIIWKAIAINLLNPKLTIFFLAFFPQFLSKNGGDGAMDAVVLSLIFMAITFIVFIGYGILANGFRHLIMSSKKIQNCLRVVFSVIFACLGLKLALQNED